MLPALVALFCADTFTFGRIGGAAAGIVLPACHARSPGWLGHVLRLQALNAELLVCHLHGHRAGSTPLPLCTRGIALSGGLGVCRHPSGLFFARAVVLMWDRGRKSPNARGRAPTRPPQRSRTSTAFRRCLGPPCLQGLKVGNGQHRNARKVALQFTHEAAFQIQDTRNLGIRRERTLKEQNRKG